MPDQNLIDQLIALAPSLRVTVNAAYTQGPDSPDRIRAVSALGLLDELLVELQNEATALAVASDDVLDFKPAEKSDEFEHVELALHTMELTDENCPALGEFVAGWEYDTGGNLTQFPALVVHIYDAAPFPPLNVYIFTDRGIIQESYATWFDSAMLQDASDLVEPQRGNWSWWME